MSEVFNIKMFLPKSKYRNTILKHVLLHRSIPFEKSTISIRDDWGETFDRNKYTFLEYVPHLNPLNFKETKGYSNTSGDCIVYKWKEGFVSAVEGYFKDSKELPIVYSGECLLTTICPVDSMRINYLVKYMMKWGRHDFNHTFDCNYRDNDFQLLLSYLKQFEKNTLEDVVNNYRHDKCGRLMSYDMEDSDQINIIALPRNVRKFIFSGIYDYDIDNAHISIILNIIRTIIGSTEPLPHIERYLKEKKELRKYYSEEYNLHIDDVKEIFLSLGYGARLDKNNHGSSIFKRFNSSAYFEKFIHDDFVKGLNSDLIKCTEMILNHFRAENGRMNVMGYIHEVNANNTSKFRRTQLSFVLLTFETIIMLKLYDRYEMNAIVYDGFMSTREYSPIEMSAYLLETTGFSLTLSEEQFPTIPLMDLGVDLRDFGFDNKQ